jgi:hypothetical protein
MPSRTDDPPQTQPEIVAVPDSRLAASPAASPPLKATDDHRLTQESFRAICSANQRAGRWEAADEIQVLAICGEVTLDFTRAELPPSGVIEIHAWSICGEVKIIVPAGAEIELEGEPILGSIEQEVREAGARDEDLPAPPPEPPYFRIDGRAILGTIKVVTDR